MAPPRQEDYSEALLQGVQVVRHSRLCHPQLPSGRRERTVLEDGEKDAQTLDAGPHYYKVSGGDYMVNAHVRDRPGEDLCSCRAVVGTRRYYRSDHEGE